MYLSYSLSFSIIILIFYTQEVVWVGGLQEIHLMSQLDSLFAPDKQDKSACNRIIEAWYALHTDSNTKFFIFCFISLDCLVYSAFLRCSRSRDLQSSHISLTSMRMREQIRLEAIVRLSI